MSRSRPGQLSVGVRSFLRGFFLWSLALAFALSGCSGGLSRGAREFRLSGRVSLGPVKDSVVSVYRVNDDGSRGELLSQGSTDENGDYETSIPEKAGPVEIVARGGRYEEESSGDEVELESDEELRAIVEEPTADAEVSVTPLTDLAAERVDSLTEQGMDVEEATQLATHEIEDASGVEDIHQAPIDPRVPAEDQQATEARKKHALVLAGLSKLAEERGIRSREMARALAQDFKRDGKFDGVSDGDPIVIENSALVLSDEVWKTALPQAMSDFVGDPHRNTAGFILADRPVLKEEPVREINIPLPSPSPVLIRPKPTRLFVNGMRNGPANACLPMILRTASNEGMTLPSQEGVLAKLTTSDGLEAFSDPTCTAPLSSLTIPGFEAVRQFFVKGPEGTFTILASDSSSDQPLSSGSNDLVLSGSSSVNLNQIYGATVAAKIRWMAPLSFPVGNCVPSHLLLLNDRDMPVPVSAPTVISLEVGQSDPALAFFSDPACSRVSTEATVPAGKTGVPVFLKATLSRRFRLTASSVGLLSFSREAESFEVSILPVTGPGVLPPVTLGLRGPSSIRGGACVPYSVALLNASGLGVPAESDLELNFIAWMGGSSTSAVFFSDPGCSVGVAQSPVSIRAGWSTATVFFESSLSGSMSLSVQTVISGPLSPVTFPLEIETEAPVILPARVVFPGPELKVPAGACVPLPIRILSQEGLLVPLPPGQSLQMGLQANLTVPLVFSDPACGNPLMNASIPEGKPGATLYVRVISRGMSVGLTAQPLGVPLLPATIMIKTL